MSPGEIDGGPTGAMLVVVVGAVALAMMWRILEQTRRTGINETDLVHGSPMPPGGAMTVGTVVATGVVVTVAVFAIFGMRRRGGAP